MSNQIPKAPDGAGPESLRISAAERMGTPLTLAVLNHLIKLMGSQAQEDIAWSETVTAPVSGDDFAREAIFVIGVSSFSVQ